MKTAIATMIALGMTSWASAQLPTLGEATPVDIRVTDVQWQPKGNAILYQREDDLGFGLGVYAVGQKQGKILLRLRQDDRWEAQWFDGEPSVVVIVYRKETSDKSVEIHILDALKCTDQLVYSTRFPEAEQLEVNVDTSPSLTHAIFRFSNGSSIRHMVLPTHGNKLLSGADIDAAVKQGFDGPSWSIDGTAIYAKDAQDTTAERDDRSRLEAFFNQEVSARERFLAKAEFKLDLDFANSFLSRKFARFGGRPIPVGSSVLELGPGRAELRQVAFKGRWDYDATSLPEVAPQDRRVLLDYGVSKGQANSLWLTMPELGADQGVLVTASATASWLSPELHGIAYLSDGALFVRPIALPIKEVQ